MFSIYQVTQDTSDLIGRNLLWCASSMLGFVVRLWGDMLNLACLVISQFQVIIKGSCDFMVKSTPR